MFESIGAQTAKQITDALPGVEKTITDAVTGVDTLVKQTLIPILAEVVSDALARVDALDGARITVSPSGKLVATVTIAVDIPTFMASVSMPLKSTGDPVQPSTAMEASK